MDDFDTVSERLAQAARTLRLLNFKLLQLRHTNEQLLAGLQELIDRATPAPGGAEDTPPPTEGMASK